MIFHMLSSFCSKKQHWNSTDWRKLICYGSWFYIWPLQKRHNIDKSSAVCSQIFDKSTSCITDMQLCSEQCRHELNQSMSIETCSTLCSTWRFFVNQNQRTCWWAELGRWHYNRNIQKWSKCDDTFNWLRNIFFAKLISFSRRLSVLIKFNKIQQRKVSAKLQLDRKTSLMDCCSLMPFDESKWSAVKYKLPRRPGRQPPVPVLVENAPRLMTFNYTAPICVRA